MLATFHLESFNQLVCERAIFFFYLVGIQQHKPGPWKHPVDCSSPTSSVSSSSLLVLCTTLSSLMPQDKVSKNQNNPMVSQRNILIFGQDLYSTVLEKQMFQPTDSVMAFMRYCSLYNNSKRKFLRDIFMTSSVLESCVITMAAWQRLNICAMKWQ